MLSLDIRSLAQRAEAVSGELAPTDPVWEDADIVPAAPVRVKGRVSSAGGGRYYFSGQMEGVASEQCPRCLDPVQVSVSEEMRAIFSEGDEDVDDDPDVYQIDGDTGLLNLAPVVREHWLLNVPRFKLCKEGCKGLCPQCGENLNHATCACIPVGDPRWNALRGLQQD